MKIGITERGDAGLDFKWFDKLSKKTFYGFPFTGAVLITKNANPKFQKKVFELIQLGFQNLIIHFTCTGWGHTPMEPNVPDFITQLSYMENMIRKGFPTDHCVIRVDPIIPTLEGMQKANMVFRQIQILQKQYQTKFRVRISIIDKYQHICDHVNPLYEYTWNSKTDFYPSYEERTNVLKLLSIYPDLCFETCAEPFLARDAQKLHITNLTECGCISEKETELFHVINPATADYPTQRKDCLCLNCKTELLENRKRCPHRCAYCYWHD